MPVTPAGIALLNFINTYIDNDPVKGFRDLRLNYILRKLNDASDAAVSGVSVWGNITGSISAQTDLISLINAGDLQLRNTVGDLTNVGWELVNNTGIYYNGILVLGTNPPFLIPVRSSDFDPDGVTCTKGIITSIPNNRYEVYCNESNRFLYWDSAMDGNPLPEIELTTDGNFKVNLTGFDANGQDYHLYIHPATS
jgi:hypothetical protein